GAPRRPRSGAHPPHAGAAVRLGALEGRNARYPGRRDGERRRADCAAIRLGQRSVTVMASVNLPERRSDTLVCTPTYNEGGSIGALLDGLLASPRPFDIVVVDDGSTDGTQDEI